MLGDLAQWTGVAVAMAGSAAGIVVAARATHHADRSATASETSAGEARRSADAAQRSADIAERSEARQTERNDVVWYGELSSTNFWVLTNTGEDVALEVVAVVTVDGERYVQEVGTVSGPGGEVRFELHELIRNKAAKDSADVRDAAQRGIGCFPSATLMIGERVLWVTPAGTPRMHVAEPGRVRTSGGRRR